VSVPPRAESDKIQRLRESQRSNAREPTASGTRAPIALRSQQARRSQEGMRPLPGQPSPHPAIGMTSSSST
jgi:hypothetical protein